MKIQEKILNNTLNPKSVVVGMEALCSLGINKNALYENIMCGKSMVNDQGLASIPWSFHEKYFSEFQIPLISASPSLKESRCLPWLFSVVKKALQEAQWPHTQGMGVIYATTTSSIDLWQSELPFFKSFEVGAKGLPNLNRSHFIDGQESNKIITLVRNQALSQSLDVLKKYFCFDGPQALITSSCSASLQALALGSKWIETGYVDKCLIVTTEILCSLTELGFESIRLLSKKICKPFDKNRSGINLGEAAAAICLQSSNDVSEKQKKWGQISGVGLSSDAYHATSPQPEGDGSFQAIQMALQEAKLSPKNLSWIYAHGTASQGNDLAEVKAFRRIFNRLPYIVSTKSFHGHTLAASGLLECVIGLMALNKNQIIMNPYTEVWDPAFGVTPDLSLIEKGEIKNNLVTAIQPMDHFLKNSLGFGGINVAVVLSRS